MNKQDLLIEIGTEELPPKALPGLSVAFSRGVEAGLNRLGLKFSDIAPFASPRRLALLVYDLDSQQADSEMEKLGPALQAAFDADGKPTRAAEGFARSCGVSVAELEQKADGKVTKLLFRAVSKGQLTTALIPDLVQQALADLPIPRRMRWGSSRDEFVRPVHWAVLLFGTEVIPARILGVDTGNQTRGHRFHHPDMLTITAPAEYENLLRNTGYVIPAFAERREQIRAQLETEGRRFKAQVIIDDDLLDEVTALVEWPVALTGSFADSYLDVPQEALISALKEHQKCFHMVDENGALLPRFITISNIESSDPQQVIAGNERVIGPRLADAAFFFQQDKKQSLASRQDKLKTVVFQQELGTVFEKSERVASLATHIARELGTSEDKALRAAQLGKCDLLTSMVYEFAELQGIMGSYYAEADDEDPEVAQALREQYLPRFAGDDLPATDAGTVLALAERLDTIVGLFSIGQPPTGSKDPFALRRAALGILRILLEKQLNLDIRQAVLAACQAMPGKFDKEEIAGAVLNFIFERLRAWYQDQNIGIDVFQAVDAVRPASPLDFDLRMQAVSRFQELPQAQALAAANKRVANILAKLDTEPSDQIDRTLLTEAAETALAQALESHRETFVDLYIKRDYAGALESLAALQPAIDTFFDQVMVNTESEAVRSNRQALLKQVRRLFLRIADISFLQSPSQAT